MMNKKETFDYDKLRGLIKERVGTEKEFADKLGITPQALSNRLGNKTDFTPAEILKAHKILLFNMSDVSAYFFTLKVQKHEQTA